MQDTAFSRFMAQLTDQPRPYAPDTSVPRLMGRDKFTRLPCLTWFRDAIAPGEGPVGCVNPPAWLGEVPLAWLGWHNPSVVQALDERLGWLLVHPVNTERGREGLLRVQVMGVHVLEVDKQRPQWLEGMPELVDFNMPMRVFEWGVSVDDAPALLEAALALASHRVVVKRARKAPAILGPAPGYVLEGKSSRFYIYPKKSLRLSVA